MIKQGKKKPITVILGDPRLPDAVKRQGQFNEEDFLTIEKLHEALEKLSDYDFTFLDNHSKLLKKLITHPPDFVLNLCDEGFNNIATEELHIPALLEMLNIPYTGAAPSSLAMCYNKALVRAIAKDLEIPVPLERFIEPGKSFTKAPFFPALVKPNLGDSSIGITQDALVHNKNQLQNYIKYLHQLLPNTAILVQEFLPGTEYTVGLIGNPGDLIELPILSVNYNELPAGLPKILGYESKWNPDSPYWNKIRYQEAKLNKRQHELLIRYATTLFTRLGCRDYARFDFRADQNGTIKLLEANPNPGWCWDGKLNLMIEASGKHYHNLFSMIITAAEKRCSFMPPKN